MSTSNWSENLPDETGLWWWWNGDEDAAPIPVAITYSGTSGNHFAMSGQYGWTQYRELSDMGGHWMRLHEPAFPGHSRAGSGEHSDQGGEIDP